MLLGSWWCGHCLSKIMKQYICMTQQGTDKPSISMPYYRVSIHILHQVTLFKCMEHIAHYNLAFWLYSNYTSLWDIKYFLDYVNVVMFLYQYHFMVFLKFLFKFETYEFGQFLAISILCMPDCRNLGLKNLGTTELWDHWKLELLI